MHSDEFSSAASDWDRRKQRIVNDKIVVVLNCADWSEQFSSEHAKLFNAIQYPKICLYMDVGNSAFDLIQQKQCIRFRKKDRLTKGKMFLEEKWWGKKYLNQFDFVDWINKSINAN